MQRVVRGFSGPIAVCRCRRLAPKAVSHHDTIRDPEERTEYRVRGVVMKRRRMKWILILTTSTEMMLMVDEEAKDHGA